MSEVKATNTQPNNMGVKLTLPRSCTNMWVNVFSLFFMIGVMLWCKYSLELEPFQAAVISMLALLIPLLLLELIFVKPFRNASTGLDFSIKQSINWWRVLVKYIGFIFSILFVGLFYWLFPEYHADFYLPFWRLLEIFLPWIMLLAIPYFALVDRFMITPRDSYWNFGKFVLGNWSGIDFAQIWQHLLGWIVKGFFLPLMFVYLNQNFNYFLEVDFAEAFANFDHVWGFSNRILILLELVFVCLGYIFTMRIFDSHIRSTEPTTLGWVSALICYEPIWSLVYSGYLMYNSDNFDWTTLWLKDSPVMFAIWGSAILLLLVIYSLSTVTFGLRFSNLTHRGILTNGMYRLCKHPAYVSKNLSWWLIAVPFIVNDNLTQTFRECFLLLILNFIYYIRARTEERHLSRDPVYVQYALAMNEKSILSWIGRLIPALQYRAPKDS